MRAVVVFVNFSQVNFNGVISFRDPFEDYYPRRFPIVYLRENNEALLSPFWDDVDPSKGGDIYHSKVADQDTTFRASRLILAALGHAFHPTTVFTATWDHVPPHKESDVSYLLLNYANKLETLMC